jgi:predicted Zn-dependent peptidase
LGNRIVHERMESGLELVVEPVEGVRSAAVMWLIPAGSATDESDRLGRSEVMSELLMRGSEGLDSRAQADAFDLVGATRGAESGSRFMRVSAVCLGERVGDVLGLLAEMVLRPRVDEDGVEAAKELARAGLESLKDDPQERAMLAARGRHYPSPWDRSGLGTSEGIESLEAAGLRSGWRARCVPGGSILAVAGAVDAGVVRACVGRVLAGWHGRAGAVEATGSAARGYGHEEDESAQVQVVVVHDAPAEPHADSVLERYVVQILSGGMSGRLFSEVREKRGLCYSVSAGYRSEREFGAVTAYVGTTPERAQESLDVLMAELDRIGAGVTAEEFERARTGLLSRVVFSGESTSARAGALAADVYAFGRARTLEEVRQRLAAVTLGDVNEYLRRRRMGRVTVQTVGKAALTPPAGV